MATVFDYVQWRGDLSFDQVAPNEVDLLIFSLLSYIDFSEQVPAVQGDSPVSLQAVANAYFAAHPSPKKNDLGFLIPGEIFTLFRQLRKTKRFRNVRMGGYVNEVDLKKEMQFSAVTFSLMQIKQLLLTAGRTIRWLGGKKT